MDRNRKACEKLIDWLKTNPDLSGDSRVLSFEHDWSRWNEVKYSVLVNSSASANHLMLHTLKSISRMRGDKVVISNLSNSSCMSSIINLGFQPIICDNNMHNLSIDLGQLESIFSHHKPGALVLPVVMGMSPDIKRIASLCKKFGVILLEENGDSIGVEFLDVKLGGFGLMSTFDVFGVGGIICTNDEKIYDYLKLISKKGNGMGLCDSLNPDWEFESIHFPGICYEPGFDLLGSNIQAQLGIQYLEGLDKFIDDRSDFIFHFMDTMKLIDKKKKVWLPTIHNDSFSPFTHIPIILPTNLDRANVSIELNKIGVISGSIFGPPIGIQPFFVKKYGVHETLNSTVLFERGMYISYNIKMNKEDVEFICKTIIDSLK